MEMEWCKEAEAQNQIVVHGHCSMDHANLGTQVGHIRGPQEAAVGPVEAGMEPRREVVHGKELAAAAVSYKEGEYIHSWLAAQEAGKMVPGDEGRSVVVNWISEFDGPLKGSCCCMDLWVQSPGRRDLPFASGHLQSFPDTGCFQSLQSHYTAASHSLLRPVSVQESLFLI